ncbi:hypothetical protein BCR35DRAFT_316499 [Leucosporidium creatinivorum]|uniref:Uncharacterized protein n=1 Tax=Leucosporidium creatinivorum TaxID=106004 RepID=A0A1Y2BZ89_9BASI|nr:hypothetical protein BCR35DRAFT_316499 [Leucosporidium creatinivorum]
MDKDVLRKQLARKFMIEEREMDELVERARAEVKKEGREVERQVWEEAIEARKDLEIKKDCVARHMYTDCWELYKPLAPDADDHEKGLYIIGITLINLKLATQGRETFQFDEKDKITKESREKWMPLYEQIGTATGFFVDKVDDGKQTGVPIPFPLYHRPKKNV